MRPVGVGVMIHSWCGEVRVTSEISRLWERVRARETVSSSCARRRGEELGFVYGGEGGSGEMGLWKE